MSKKELEDIINVIEEKVARKCLPLKLVIDYEYIMPILKNIRKDLERLEKLEKAIEILKKKDIDMEELLKSYNVDEYNKRSFKANILTQQEYALLKEVLEENNYESCNI